MVTEVRPPVPPFTEETARAKVKAAENAWNSRDPDVVAKAYTQDREFYSFYRSINAYRSSIGQPGDIMVISPDNEFFRYLNNSSGTE